MIAEVRFQDDDTIPPIRVNGSWEFAEHTCRQYGDHHGFVPHSRMKITSRYGYNFVSYIGTMSNTGHSGILYIGEHDFIKHEGEMFEETGEEELKPYIIDEYLCDEEDMRPDDER